MWIKYVAIGKRETCIHKRETCIRSWDAFIPKWEVFILVAGRIYTTGGRYIYQLFFARSGQFSPGRRVSSDLNGLIWGDYWASSGVNGSVQVDTGRDIYASGKDTYSTGRRLGRQVGKIYTKAGLLSMAV